MHEKRGLNEGFWTKMFPKLTFLTLLRWSLKRSELLLVMGANENRPRYDAIR